MFYLPPGRLLFPPPEFPYIKLDMVIDAEDEPIVNVYVLPDAPMAEVVSSSSFVNHA